LRCHQSLHLPILPPSIKRTRSHLGLFGLHGCNNQTLSWELHQVAFTPEEHACSADWLNVLDREHAGKFTLSSICQSLVVKRRSSIWLYTFITLGTLAAV